MTERKMMRGHIGAVAAEAEAEAEAVDMNLKFIFLKRYSHDW
jgi:hypothetical protein